MYCNKCGTKNSLKGLFCKKCGASLVEEVFEESYRYDDSSNSKKEKTIKNINKTVNKTKTINKTINKEKKKDTKEKNNREVRTEIIHKTSTFQKIVITLLIVLVIVLLGALLASGLYIFQDKTVEIPGVVGSKVDQATMILENIDLNVKIKTQEVSDSNKHNVVLKQNKKVGEFVAKNSTIILTIGKYELNRLENFVGLTKKEAISRLKKLKLNYEIEEIESVDSDDLVISQTPTAGAKYDSNTKVILSISKKVIEKKETKIDEEKDNEDNSESKIDNSY